MTTDTNYHIPVLLKESVNGLMLKPDAIVVDATFGGGGHSAYILSKLSQKGFLFGFDQDIDAVSNALKAPNFKLIEANFKHLKNHLFAEGIVEVDAILADIGVSSHQFDAEKRGFSFRAEAPLDMRMNQRTGRTAASFLNEASEEELLRIFNTYSDLNNVFRLVQGLLRERSVQPFYSTGDLLKVAKSFAPKNREHKYIAQVFQALRIETNDEIGVLKKLLLDAKDLLKKGGRISVISYHSIEDRVVKNYFKKGDTDGVETKDFYGNLIKPFLEVNRHPIVPGEKEIERNNRARSAKLRIAEKV
ncbi:MAG: 16S rRNA (cytosine(1402)-N(4))-methyltransferase RsmH [Bacteroidetes bacterium]|nr:16S rRNA (cytosine(1402)-N(4))-methyltransferase RsmH [Bacteroidota bacterium]MBM3424079.1 16S rRNA (cytosine(1402)-N(4))-methyltransferase RsmH [Bacteroidota bacterium]